MQVMNTLKPTYCLTDKCGQSQTFQAFETDTTSRESGSSAHAHDIQQVVIQFWLQLCFVGPVQLSHHKRGKQFKEQD